MKEIIDNIQKELRDNLSKLQYIDEDWGQLDYYSTNPPVKYPCALLSIDNVNFSDIGTDRSLLPVNRQQGACVVTVTVADLKLTNTSGMAPKFQKEQANNIWSIITETHELLHGQVPAENCGKLMRTSLQHIRRDDGIQEYRISYSLGLHNI